MRLKFIHDTQIKKYIKKVSMGKQTRNLCILKNV
jgi:hypothetical protein